MFNLKKATQMNDEYFQVLVETEHSNVKDPVGKEFESIEVFSKYEDACEYAERLSTIPHSKGKFFLVRKVKMGLKYPPTFIRMAYFLSGKVYRYSEL